MKKRSIKIVKRDSPVSKPVLPLEQPKDPERIITSAVKNWISERRENSEAETSSNARQFLTWSKLPDTSGKAA